MKNTIAPLALAAAPLAGLARSLLLPTLTGTGAERLGAIEAGSGRFLAGNLLLLLSFVLFVPAIIAMAGLLRNRGMRWGSTAALAAAAGWILHLAIIGSVLSQYPMALAPEREVMGTLADALFEEPSFMALLVPMLLLSEIGIVVAAVALWHSRSVPRWTPVLLVAALVVELAAPSPFDAVGLYVLLAAALVPVAISLRRGDDAVRDAAVESTASLQKRSF